MRKLGYSIDLMHFREIKQEIVPVLFTEHQFDLIEKKFAGEKMTRSEKNEFSRTISRKMKAITKIMEKETDNVFIYGQEKIKQSRSSPIIKYLKKFSRRFKNKHVIISGSFLYNEMYNDIDIFVVSKYEKDDYHEGKFHINYLTEDVYHSLFFASLKQLCVSNRKLGSYDIQENINIDTFISLYQELFTDLDREFEGVKTTLRDFIIQAAFIRKSTLPGPLELMQQVDSILRLKKSKEIVKKIFVDAVVIGVNPKKAVIAMKEMIQSYKEIMNEYNQHKNYYLDLMQAFSEVISIEC